MKKILWNDDGWTMLQEADAAKHVLEVSCFAEKGTVTEVRIRHNDGEQTKGKATIDEKNILPLPLDEFKELYKKKKITFR